MTHNFEDLQSMNDSSWDLPKEKESRIHSIHPYPAKFPAFIAGMAMEHAERKGIEVKTVADIFCGCGTTAVEAKKKGLNFWGTDINPVAVLIAKAKAGYYKTEIIEDYYRKVVDRASKIEAFNGGMDVINERIRYWHKESEIAELLKLRKAIYEVISGKSSYRCLFLCMFSSILKPTSRWLMRSIKSQVDPNKKIPPVMEEFAKRYRRIVVANEEKVFEYKKGKTAIYAHDFLSSKPLREASRETDLIVTSPPYVTSYDYADIHQLSALWLGYVEDYRDLRKHMIGNRCHSQTIEEAMDNVNTLAAKETCAQLLQKDKSRCRSVAKYFSDMEKVAEKSFNALRRGGIAVFVIGNTRYKDVKISNIEHYQECMEMCGFKNVNKSSRQISSKSMTPYRDKKGRFSRNSQGQGMVIYAKEAVLIGEKP